MTHSRRYVWAGSCPGWDGNPFNSQWPSTSLSVAALASVPQLVGISAVVKNTLAMLNNSAANGFFERAFEMLDLRSF